jgi:hypothetical protein
MKSRPQSSSGRRMHAGSHAPVYKAVGTGRRSHAVYGTVLNHFELEPQLHCPPDNTLLIACKNDINRRPPPPPSAAHVPPAAPHCPHSVLPWHLPPAGWTSPAASLHLPPSPWLLEELVAQRVAWRWQVTIRAAAVEPLTLMSIPSPLLVMLLMAWGWTWSDLDCLT